MNAFFSATSTGTISAIAVILSGLFFLLYSWSTRRKLSSKGFLLSDRSISGTAYANTYSATNVSLAANIIFFVSAYQSYGWMMGLAVIAYTIVQLFILALVRRINIDFNQIRTISDLWYAVFPSRKIARIISGIVVAGCLFSVFVELYFGSVIVSMFFADTPFNKAATFFVLGALTLSYVYFGGYKAVIKTDKWQMGLLMLAASALIAFSYFIPTLDTVSKNASELLFSHSESGSSLFIFLLWVCSLNIFLCFIDIDTWQRMSACKSISEASQGLINGLWKLALVFWGPMMAIIVIGFKGYEFSNLPEFIGVIAAQDALYSYIVTPIVVVGFAAALFSTADTKLMSAIYGLCDDNTFRPLIDKLDKQTDGALVLRKYLVRAFMVAVFAISILYYIQGSDIADLVMPAIYATWGILIGLSILPIYAFYRIFKGMPKAKVTTSRENTIVASLVLASIVTLMGSYWEYTTGEMIYSQLANLLTVVVVFAGIGVAFRSEKSQSKSSMPGKLREKLS